MSQKGKIIRIALGALTVVLLALAVFMSPKRGEPLPDIEIGEEEKEDLLAARTESKKKLEASVSFGGIDLAYDAVGDVYYYSMPEGAVSAVTPDVKAVGIKGPLDVAFPEGQRITDELISSNTPLEAIVYNAEEYRRIKIVCTTLPIISVACDDEIEDEYVPMEMRVYDNRRDATNRLTICSGKIHVRGNTSAMYSKKAYRITLSDLSPGKNRRELDISLLGMRKDGDWILYAAYNDQERVRNVMSSNLWYDTSAKRNGFGVDNGMEYRYCELFVNGYYCGLYALGFPIDEIQLGIGRGEYTYKKYTWKREMSIDYLDTDAINDNYTIREGEIDAGWSEAWAPLARYYTFLQSVDSADKKLYGICDIDNAVDVFLYLCFVQGVDNVNGWASLNLLQTVKKSDGSPVMLFTPWDMDQTYGNHWNADKPNFIFAYGTPAHTISVMKFSPVYLLMMHGDRDMIKTVQDRYRELRSGEWSDGAIDALIDRYEKIIFGSGAYLRDIERWPESSMIDDPSRGLDDFRAYVKEHIKYTDDYIYGLDSADLAEKYEVFDYGDRK